MADKKLKFKIATPERVVYESTVDSVTCPTEMGEITVLPNHIPLVANLKPGELKVVQAGEEKYIAVSGGFIEVRPFPFSPPARGGDGEGVGGERSTEVIILADAAEHAEEIDIAKAEAARERARKAMAEEILSEEEYAATAAALERSLARLRVAGRKKYKDVGRSTR